MNVDWIVTDCIKFKDLEGLCFYNQRVCVWSSLAS